MYLSPAYFIEDATCIVQIIVVWYADNAIIQQYPRQYVGESTMNCSRCGTFLAEGINICPKCGMPATSYPPSTPSYDPPSYDPTVPASYVRQQTPATSYGPNLYPPQPNANDPYGPPPQSPYNNVPVPPYNNMQPFQPPSNGGRKGPGPVVLVGLALLLIVVIGGGLALLTSHKHSGQTTTSQATPKATSRPAPTPTPDLTKNPYPPGTGTLVVNDPMQDNSKGNEWDESTTPITGGGSEICQFNNGAYHVIRTVRGSLVCLAQASSLTPSNLAFEAKLTVIKGDYAGIAFRINSVQETGYVFGIGVGGDYVIDTFNFRAPVSNEFTILAKGSSSAIKRGWNQSNLAAIVANGANISLYINGQPVTQIQDNTYTQGQIGIYGYGQTTSDIETQGVRMWNL
jgi:hypothetical protein